MRFVIFLLLLLLLLLVIIKYTRPEEKFISDKYPVKEIIYKKNNTIIYTLKHDDKHLYKKYRDTSPYNIKQEVDILNSTDLSPNVIDYGDDFYIIERLDMTLKELVQNGMVNKEIIQKFIDFNRKLDLFKYKHLDLHWENLLWDNTKREFKVIDWSNIREQKPSRYNLPDKLYLFKKIDEYSHGGPIFLKKIAKNLVMNKYEGNEIKKEDQYLKVVKDF